jgi:hypothetical protein
VLLPLLVLRRNALLWLLLLLYFFCFALLCTFSSWTLRQQSQDVSKCAPSVF